MRTLDSNYSDWKIGDKVVWELEPYHTSSPLEIVGIDRENRIIYYETAKGDKNQVKREYLMRVTETEISKTGVNDLEKLINDLCELPSFDLVGDEDTVTVQWASSSDRSTAFVKLGEWSETIYLDPGQALLLLAWLKPQEEKLVELRDALQAKQIEEAATKEQRAAERINALKVLHSDAVVAWQQGGCEGPCPRYEDIAFKEQFVEVSLGVTEMAPAFVNHYPMLERLRKEQRG